MNKKKLDEHSVLNELTGNSLFFRQAVSPPDEAVVPLSPAPRPTPEPPATPKPPDTMTPRYHDTTRDTVVSRHHETSLETVRRAVKKFGKEAATHRFTAEEKHALKAVERAYYEQGVKTSENEITRIAINYLLDDYQRNGATSILANVLGMLNS